MKANLSNIYTDRKNNTVLKLLYNLIKAIESIDFASEPEVIELKTLISTTKEELTTELENTKTELNNDIADVETNVESLKQGFSVSNDNEVVVGNGNGDDVRPIYFNSDYFTFTDDSASVHTLDNTFVKRKIASNINKPYYLYRLIDEDESTSSNNMYFYGLYWNRRQVIRFDTNRPSGVYPKFRSIQICSPTNYLAEDSYTSYVYYLPDPEDNTSVSLTRTCTLATKKDVEEAKNAIPTYYHHTLRIIITSAIDGNITTSGDAYLTLILRSDTSITTLEDLYEIFLPEEIDFKFNVSGGYKYLNNFVYCYALEATNIGLDNPIISLKGYLATGSTKDLPIYEASFSIIEIDDTVSEI